MEGISFQDVAVHPITLGIFIGLLVGKPIGICLCSWLALRFFKAELPFGMTWRHIIGVSFLGGIGFTISFFISGLSFATPENLEYAKLGILSSSILAGTVGYFILVYSDIQPLDKRS